MHPVLFEECLVAWSEPKKRQSQPETLQDWRLSLLEIAKVLCGVQRALQAPSEPSSSLPQRASLPEWPAALRLEVLKSSSREKLVFRTAPQLSREALLTLETLQQELSV